MGNLFNLFSFKQKDNRITLALEDLFYKFCVKNFRRKNTIIFNQGLLLRVGRNHTNCSVCCLISSMVKSYFMCENFVIRKKKRDKLIKFWKIKVKPIGSISKLDFVCQVLLQLIAVSRWYFIKQNVSISL